MASIEPRLPKHQPGTRRVYDRRLISGIIHILTTGCDCPAEHGPPTAVCNRFHHWSRRRFRNSLLEALAGAGAVTKSAAMASTYVRAQRSTFGGRGGHDRSAPPGGGQTSKIHGLTDVIGRPFAPTLTPGNVSDMKAAAELLARLRGTGYAIADKGYNADALRRSLCRSISGTHAQGGKART